MTSRQTIIIFGILTAFFLTPDISFSDKRQDEVLNAVEGFFVALRERRFADAWELLTDRTKETIIDEVYRDINKTKTKIGREVIKEEFDIKGELFHIYWDTFMKNFDPDAILEQSVWNMPEIKTDKAVIITRHKKSEYPSELKAYRENGKWRFGLVESFWTRKIK